MVGKEETSASRHTFGMLVQLRAAVEDDCSWSVLHSGSNGLLNSLRAISICELVNSKTVDFNLLFRLGKYSD
jgi:hypothetical protein